MEDGELVELCRSGDGDAFAILLQRHERALYGLASRILGDRDEAFDALQDACVKAWRAIGTLRGDSFKGWMSTIVARTSLDRVRSRRREESLDDDDVRVIPLPDPRPGPEDTTVARERMAQVERALATLTPEHRAVVLMRDQGGMSYDEIARGLGVPVGTVRSRLARARLGLQTELVRLDPTILEAQA